MLKDAQNQAMIGLQDALNSKINPNWTVAHDNWMLAGAMELMEGIDHHGWRWWKKQEQNIPLLQNELVDYWHFVLSRSIIDSEGDHGKALYFLTPTSYKPHDVFTFDDKGYVIAEMSTVEKLFALSALAFSNRFEFYLFESLMKDVGLDWDNLFNQYIAKNVLNIFRQDHGYKEGTYLKIWFDSREDNEHMLDLLNHYSHLITEPEFVSVLYTDLQNRYSVTVQKQINNQV